MRCSQSITNPAKGTCEGSYFLEGNTEAQRACQRTSPHRGQTAQGGSHHDLGVWGVSARSLQAFTADSSAAPVTAQWPSSPPSVVEARMPQRADFPTFHPGHCGLLGVLMERQGQDLSPGPGACRAGLELGGQGAGPRWRPQRQPARTPCHGGIPVSGDERCRKEEGQVVGVKEAPDPPIPPRPFWLDPRHLLRGSNPNLHAAH